MCHSSYICGFPTYHAKHIFHFLPCTLRTYYIRGPYAVRRTLIYPISMIRTRVYLTFTVRVYILNPRYVCVYNHASISYIHGPYVYISYFHGRTAYAVDIYIIYSRSICLYILHPRSVRFYILHLRSVRVYILLPRSVRRTV